MTSDDFDGYGGSEDDLDIDPDVGYSPAERPFGVSAWGITEREAAGHEDLAHRLAREEPDVGDLPGFDDIGDDIGDGIGDAEDTDGEPLDDQVGDRRSGRLVSAEIDPTDPGSDYSARDVGVDGAGASAEEAAIHTVPDDDLAADRFDLFPDDVSDGED